MYAYARSARGCARSCVYWEGGWKSGEECEEGGVNEERKDCRWKNEGEEDGREGEARNEKAFTQCKKGCAGKIKGEISRRIARSRTQNEARREKSELRRVKNESDSSKKCRKLSLKRGKAGKTEIWERKRWGEIGRASCRERVSSPV